MGNSSLNTDADPREVERAREGWQYFTEKVKWGVMTTVALVVLLAWITL